MYLKQLEIHGFKSFAEKIELNFVNAINAVVGPNGSGKSNISDAIRWVLGEQSVKALRGSKMEDVIFAGSDNKKALGFAEVSLSIDNSDKIIPVEYTEINITRRLYRSGDNEYFINKTQCRLKDVYELFMDTGIGKDGYSIIGQGRIDEILSSKSDERRLVFEEAAGIVKYKSRKHEAEKKLEQTKNNIIRIEDIIEEIEGQLDPLKEQAEVAKQYLIVMNELKSIEINLFVNNIEKYKDKLESIVNEEAQLDNQINENLAEAAILDNRQNEIKLNISNVEEDIFSMSEDAHGKINLCEKLQGECNVLSERIKNMLKNRDRLTESIDEVKEELEKLKESRNESAMQLEILTTIADDTNIKLAQRTREFDAKYNASMESEAKLNANQQKYINAINRHSELKSKVNSSYVFIENINRRLKQLEEDILRLSEQYNEKEKALFEINESVQGNNNQISMVQSEIDGQFTNRKHLEAELSNLDGKANRKKSEREAVFHKLKLLEEMEKDHGGFSKTVKSLLNDAVGIIKGNCGVIGEMISVKAEHVTAVEMALGGSVQSIVTDDENDAKKLIEYLKENKLGRATFLPITSVKPRYFNDREKKLMEIDGFIGMAADLVKYDKKIENIMMSLLGRIAVVDNIDNAIKLARIAGYDYRIVTLAGEIINAGGSITGGSIHSTGTSVLSRKVEIESLTVQLKEKNAELEELQQKIDGIKREISAASELIAHKREQHHNLLIEKNNIKNKSDNAINELQIIKDRISIAEKETDDLNIEYKSTIEIIDENNLKAENANKEKELLEQEINSLQEQLRQTNEIKEKFNNEITDIRIKLTSIEHNKESLTNTIKDIDANILDMSQEHQQMTTEIDTSANEIFEYEISINNKKAELTELKEKIDKEKAEIEEKEKKKSELQMSLYQTENSIKELARFAANLQNAMHKIEMQQTKFEVELENVEMKLLETYDMNYGKAVGFKDTSINLSWAGKRCEELKNEIREIGTVNVNAVEEYEKLSERYEFLTKQISDLKNARETLINVIEEISENMRKQFITEFYKINENFNEVFVKLFGGGQAQLVIADMDNILESGIDIIAKPPGKKLQNLLLLSGGERALTAIALLFGILKMKPAPFCVLDEIDAALDDANVDRYAKFLVELSETTQFIIVTHRKGSMEVADCLYGVSMENSGISKLVSVKLEDQAS